MTVVNPLSLSGIPQSLAGQMRAKKLAIMQPYFFPYIGYFQLIAAVDVFIIYDNIKYTKKGWINRNRILQDQTDKLISLPLKNASDHLAVCQRELAENFDAKKLLNQINSAYLHAPYFSHTYPLLVSILQYSDHNLFHFLHNSVISICRHLGITTTIIPSSSLAIDHGLKGQDKVLALCQAMRASHYLNAIGGQELYAKADFLAHDIALQFLQSERREYQQFSAAFVPWLSIIDVMMFNSPDEISDYLKNGYTLL